MLFAFDILSLRGKDLRNLPLLKRKNIVQQALQRPQRVRPVQHVG
jgi:ATP-dependent DNA ligase